MSGRTRHSQYFDADGSWVRGYWRVINGTPYKFARIQTTDDDVVIMAMPMDGEYAHCLVYEKRDDGASADAE